MCDCNDDDSFAAGFMRRDREFRNWPVPDLAKIAEDNRAAQLERIARQLCEADGYLPDSESNDPFDDGQKTWTLYLEDARKKLSEQE